MPLPSEVGPRPKYAKYAILVRGNFSGGGLKTASQGRPHISRGGTALGGNAECRATGTIFKTNETRRSI